MLSLAPALLLSAGISNALTRTIASEDWFQLPGQVCAWCTRRCRRGCLCSRHSHASCCTRGGARALLGKTSVTELRKNILILLPVLSPIAAWPDLASIEYKFRILPTGLSAWQACGRPLTGNWTLLDPAHSRNGLQIGSHGRYLQQDEDEDGVVITKVSSFKDLKKAWTDGVAHIEVTSHLDATNFPLVEAEVNNEVFQHLLPMQLPTTRSVRVCRASCALIH